MHEQDDEISTWFYESRRTGNFFKNICEARINGCNSQVVQEYLAKQVEVEEESKKAAKDKEETPKKQDTPKKEAPKKQDTPKEKQDTKATQSAMDPSEMVNKIVNRVKGNMIRIYRLSGELYRDTSQIIRTKNWDKLKKDLKGPEFWRKYWIVFVAAFSLVYLFASFLEMIFGKPVKKEKRPSGATGKRRTTKTKKDE